VSARCNASASVVTSLRAPAHYDHTIDVHRCPSTWLTMPSPIGRGCQHRPPPDPFRLKPPCASPAPRCGLSSPPIRFAASALDGFGAWGAGLGTGSAPVQHPQASRLKACRLSWGVVMVAPTARFIRHLSPLPLWGEGRGERLHVKTEARHAPLSCQASRLPLFGLGGTENIPSGSALTYARSRSGWGLQSPSGAA
jgi:hypothetical protein